MEKGEGGRGEEAREEGRGKEGTNLPHGRLQTLAALHLFGKKMRYKLHFYAKKLPFQHAALNKTLCVRLQLSTSGDGDLSGSRLNKMYCWPTVTQSTVTVNPDERTLNMRPYHCTD